MFYTAVIRWSVFFLTLPIRAIAGEEAHEKAYSGIMKVVSVFSFILLVAIVLAAISGSSN